VTTSFYGNDIMISMRRAASGETGSTLFAYRVIDPERYGVVDYEIDPRGRARDTALIEKTEEPTSALAVTGLFSLMNVSQISPKLSVRHREVSYCKRLSP
jgi:glucose-1-phosphate thymidylyltransferase